MKIKEKLLTTFGLLILVSFIITGINELTYRGMEDDADFINSAGRLRANSYRMATLLILQKMKEMKRV